MDQKTVAWAIAIAGMIALVGWAADADLRRLYGQSRALTAFWVTTRNAVLLGWATLLLAVFLGAARDGEAHSTLAAIAAAAFVAAVYFRKLLPRPVRDAPEWMAQRIDAVIGFTGRCIVHVAKGLFWLTGLVIIAAIGYVAFRWIAALPVSVAILIGACIIGGAVSAQRR